MCIITCNRGMIKFSCRSRSRNKDDTVGDGSFLTVNRIIKNTEFRWPLLARRVCGGAALIKTNSRNASCLNHQFCGMIKAETIVWIWRIDLNGNDLSVRGYSEACTRINFLSLVCGTGIIRQLVFTVPNYQLIPLNSLCNLILIGYPSILLIYHGRTVFKNCKERISVTFRIRTVYLTVDCECTAGLSRRCVEKCGVYTRNYLVVFAGMICFSGSDLIGQPLKSPNRALVIVVTCFYRYRIYT